MITKANQSIQTLCDRTESDMENSRLSGCLPDARLGLMALPSSPFDTYVVTRVGQHIPVQATVSRVATSGDAIFTVVLRDLSERVARSVNLNTAPPTIALQACSTGRLFGRVDETPERHQSGCLDLS